MSATIGSPVIIGFKDVNGNWIEGKSESITRHATLFLRVEAKDEFGNLTAVREGPSNMTLKQFAQFVQANILNSAQTVTDTSNTARSVSANSASTAINIVAGTSTTAATFTDFKLGTQQGGSSGSQAATVNAISGQSFTVTATITNTSGGSVNYAEVGIQNTAATFTFQLCHDVFTAVTVSNNGTLAVTYTISFS
jgi:hypothetical protein